MKRCTNCGLVVKNSEMNFCSACGQKMVTVQSETVAVEGQGFCMFCGDQFNEFGVCPRCGNKRNSQIKATTKQEHYWDKLLACTKALFSAMPFNGIENAGRETGHRIWPICLAVFAVFSSLGITNVLYQKGSVEGLELTMADQFGISASFFGILVRVLLAALLTFFASTALLAVLVRFSGSKLPYVQLMNANAFSLIPFSLASLLSFAVAFFSRDIALLVLPVGIIMSAIMLYYAIQKLVRYNASPYWIFAGVLAGDIAACVLSMLLSNKLFG